MGMSALPPRAAMLGVGNCCRISARSGPTAIRSQALTTPTMHLSSTLVDAAPYTFGHDFGRDDADALKLGPLPSQSSFHSRWHQSFYLPRPTICESYP